MTDDTFEQDLDRRLEHLFVIPPDAGRRAVDALRERGRRKPSSSVRRLRPLLGLAASVAVLAGVLHFSMREEATHPEVASNDPRQTPATNRMSAASLHELYAETVRGLPLGQSCLASKETLAEIFRERYGRELPINVNSATALHGPLPCAPWPEATVLLAEAQPEPIVFLVAKADADPDPPQPGGDLRMHRQVVDGFVIYELSNASQSICLDLFPPSGN